MDKIIEDQEEFEKEHRFMQVWMVLFRFLSSAKLELKSILHNGPIDVIKEPKNVFVFLCSGRKSRFKL